jgi:hypothetical protein
MRAAIYFVLCALMALASAQRGWNPFKIPEGGYNFTVGEPTTLYWKSNTKGTVSLILQHGDYFMPKDGRPIASEHHTRSPEWDRRN